ncbi:protein NUCLEAR FUSION DEFECTIVE 6, mitochondrial-like isoform X2 [Diospyros lotus]|uniref:protein NUCLEAR FUSION DEFECTIVE 6, mitochondrial-like isoform X2 n=1 Tax=Diospyros lotus TaxID=55363 RepID=UPI0022543E68|nr:protein NUCLEAR FUSION DEFECTIVE 6, mitochondrial-like isoform X2 [Diospyros lotus]
MSSVKHAARVQGLAPSVSNQNPKTFTTGTNTKAERSFTLSTMAAAAAASRTLFRSPSVRKAAAKVASEAKAARSPFSSSTRKPLSHRIFSCPAEMSVCVGSMQPFHTATASALMTSMLSISRRTYGWLPEASNDGV